MSVSLVCPPARRSSATSCVVIPLSSAWTAILLAVACATPASAAITAIRGTAEASITEFQGAVEGQSEKVFDDFPATQTELPLQVVARLIAGGSEIAGGVVASQFADPRLVAGPNPEEFAINLSLDSVTAGTHYVAQANATEIRDVVFNVGELGDQPAGTEVTLLGRLTIEGTLAMFSAVPDRDLTGAHVTLLVTVTRQVPGQIDQIVFSGNVILRGAPDGGVQVTTSGQFPSNTLILSNLGAVTPGVFTLQALILPSVPITYEYRAVVGEPLALVASVQVDAENIADNCGVAALLGTPTDLLEDVIGATQGLPTAKNLLKSLADERAEPSGVPAIPPPTPLLCGVITLPTLLPMLVVPALLYRRRPRSPVC